LTLAWFFRGSPNPQPGFFLASTAVRLSHTIGLHHSAEQPSPRPSDREQQKRIFWIAVILDTSVSIRTGRPTTHSHLANETRIALPSDSPKDNLGIIVNRQGSVAFNILCARAKFAILEVKISRFLRFRANVYQPPESSDRMLSELRNELDEWKGMLPVCQGSSSITYDWDSRYPHIVCMHAAYECCIITMFSSAWQNEFSAWRARQAARSQNRKTPLSYIDVCLQAACNIVELLILLPRGEVTLL
jgi:hypothetical protein